MAIETQNGYPSIRITAGERVLRKAAELVPYEENPRRHGEKQMQALRRSLREFGFLRPLLIDRENRLVAGQAVLQAAMAEGMDVVPCILAEGLTAEQRRAYILADNRLAELAARCQNEGIALTIVLPPMAENVRTEVCDTFGITEAMQDEVLPELHAIAAETGCTLLDYEWNGSCITDDDTQFFDGFHLDEKYGLPDWTEELFTDIG